MKIKFLLFSEQQANRINRKLIFIGERLNKIFFNVKYDLAKADIDLNAEKFLTAAFLSALIYGLIFFSATFALFFIKDGQITAINTIIAALIGTAFLAMFFFLHIFYPKLLGKKHATEIDQSLLFALKSMLIQVSSGVSLFNSMVNVSKSNYGTVSGEFENVVKEITAGESEAKALEKLALKTKSNYLKKTSWQLLTSLRSGSSLQGALLSVVDMMTNQQRIAIKNYAQELNFWILMYLLFAAALPTLGITFLVILSTMGGAPVGPEQIALIAAFAVIIQIILIGLVQTRIPKVYS